mgnify:FL=1
MCPFKKAARLLKRPEGYTFKYDGCVVDVLSRRVVFSETTFRCVGRGANENKSQREE